MTRTLQSSDRDASAQKRERLQRILAAVGPTNSETERGHRVKALRAHAAPPQRASVSELVRDLWTPRRPFLLLSPSFSYNAVIILTMNHEQPDEEQIEKMMQFKECMRELAKTYPALRGPNFNPDELGERERVLAEKHQDKTLSVEDIRQYEKEIGYSYATSHDQWDTFGCFAGWLRTESAGIEVQRMVAAGLKIRDPYRNRKK